MKVSKWKSTMFIAPFLVCFGLFWLAPFVYGIYMSLHLISHGNDTLHGQEYPVMFQVKEGEHLEIIKE